MSSAHPNLFTATYEYDEADPPGYRSGVLRLGPGDGKSELSVRAFVIPAGESLCPYHYEYVEEWLILLDGELDLRTPAGLERLHAGDAVRFPPGPDGAHKTTNPGASPARVVMFSSAWEPSVSVYPDSDKIGIWTPGGVDNLMLKRSDGNVPYYEGEG